MDIAKCCLWTSVGKRASSAGMTQRSFDEEAEDRISAEERVRELESEVRRLQGR